MEFFTYTLPNGIRCIYKRIKSPVAYCAVTVNTGSRDELAAEQGMAHFTEHMLFKGTQHRRAYHINSRLEKLGGELNAFTTKEETVVHATTLKTDYTKAAELISDVIFNSTFPPHEVEREKEVVLDEINSCKDSPPERIYDEFEDMLFAGSPLGHNILGTKASVSKMTEESVRNFTGRCYNTDQVLFSLSADVTEKSFLKTAERYFGVIPASCRTFSRSAPGEAKPFSKSVGRNTHQAHCIMGARAYDNKHPRRIALALLVNILGGPAANSRLNVLLREKNGLTYNAEAGYTPYSDTGIATIYFSSDRDNTHRCMQLAEHLLDEAKNKPLSTLQLAAAKKQFAGQFSIAMEGKEGYMLGAAKSYLLHNEIDTPEAVYKKLCSVTSAEIMEVANEIFGAPLTLIYK